MTPLSIAHPFDNGQGRSDNPCVNLACENSSRWETPEATLSQSWLLWGLLFGSFGFGFFVYGKKQRAVVPLVCGLALMIFPYFVSNTILLVAIRIMLIVAPYFVRI